ncbi:MAG: hypothetical protein R6X16_12955 [Anaerolineae bacterium]
MTDHEDPFTLVFPVLWVHVSDGLFHTHRALNANATRMLGSAFSLYALVQLLSERGLISIEVLNERKRVVDERLVGRFRREGIGTISLDWGNRPTFAKSTEFDPFPVSTQFGGDTAWCSSMSREILS